VKLQLEPAARTTAALTLLLTQAATLASAPIILEFLYFMRAWSSGHAARSVRLILLSLWPKRVVSMVSTNGLKM